jgi:uncharacterized membrane protein
MSKIKDYLTLRYLIFGLPKYISKLHLAISIIYIFAYFFLSIYKIFIEDYNGWIYITILILTIVSALFLIIYYLTNRRNYQKKHLKNTQSYLSILVNILKLLFIGSNILVLISVGNINEPADIIALVFSSIYLIYIVISTIINMIMIIVRMINFKKYLPLIKNKDIVEYVANDIRQSIKENPIP